MAHGVRGVVAVVDLEAGEPGVDHLLDDRVGDDPAAGGRPRVRDDRRSPGGADDLDGAHRVGRVVRDVVGAVVAEDRRERLVAVGDDAGAHEGVGDVRPTRRGAGLDLGPHRLDGHGDAVGRHPRDHPVEAGVARAAGVLELGGEVGVRRVGEVGEEVDALPPAGARHLDARDEGEAEPPGRARGVVPADRRVVVGEGDGVETGLRGPLHDDRGRLGPVARGGVRVEVDRHLVSVVVGSRASRRATFRAVVA